MKKRWFIGMFVKQYQNYIRTSINPFLEKLVSIYFLIPVLTAVRNRNYKIRKTIYTQTFASFINLHTKIGNGVRLKTQLYAKRNDFILYVLMSVFFPYYLSLRSYVRVFPYYLSLRSYVRVFCLLFVFTFLFPCFFPIICLYVLMSVFFPYYLSLRNREKTRT
jgi:hypothetical protein